MSSDPGAAKTTPAYVDEPLIDLAEPTKSEGLGGPVDKEAKIASTSTSTDGKEEEDEDQVTEDNLLPLEDKRELDQEKHHGSKELDKSLVQDGVNDELSAKVKESLQLDRASSSRIDPSETVSQPSSAVEPSTLTSTPPPPSPPPKDDKFASQGRSIGLGLDTGFKDAKGTMKGGYSKLPQAGADDEPRDDESEIASIMEQFDDGKDALGEQEIMSPRLEIAQPMFATPNNQHPPRKSSLEPIVDRSSTPESLRKSGSTLISPPPRTSSLALGGLPATSMKGQATIPAEPESPAPLTPVASTKSLPPPPQPDPEPDLPFDFQRFLEQLRHKSADPVAKYLRSFLLEFGKKPWMVHEQVKIISDFLEFITKKMGGCEVWRSVSDAEFDNAREGMEKLVMNRLYSQTFSPAIPAPEASGRSKRRHGDAPAAGRRGQHQEDVERDEVLAQKVRIYGWIREEHLDIPPIGDKGKKFMDLAQKGMGTNHVLRHLVIC